MTADIETTPPQPQEHQPDMGQPLRTYHGVLIGLRYVVLATLVACTFLILAFCTSASYLTAAVVSLIVLGVGLYLAKDRQSHSWMSDAGTLFISTSVDSGAPHR